MLRALEWCPFLTSQLKKCQVSDKICPAGLIGFNISEIFFQKRVLERYGNLPEENKLKV